MMTGKETSNAPEYPSPEEMQGWLEREIADAARATELRIKEASSFVAAYTRGEISAGEAADRGYQYSCRWGEVLPGVWRSRGMTDEEILAKIDATRAKQGLIPEDLSGKRPRGRSSENSR